MQNKCMNYLLWSLTKTITFSTCLWLIGNAYAKSFRFDSFPAYHLSIYWLNYICCLCSWFFIYFCCLFFWWCGPFEFTLICAVFIINKSRGCGIAWAGLTHSTFPHIALPLPSQDHLDFKRHMSLSFVCWVIWCERWIFVFS